jgi:glucose-6-phosphate 1-dehydrogenase
VVRDVLQNHLLELVALVAADLPPPGSTDPVDRVALLKQVADASSSNVKLGQYVGYAAHVSADSQGKKTSTNTATAATVQLDIDSDRWRGVPFFLSAGKALDERAAYVRVQFKPSLLNSDPGAPCEVIFHLQGGSLGTATVVCSALPAPAFPEGWSHAYGENGGTVGTPVEKAPNPYNVLLRGVVEGRRDLFCGTGELYELWRVWTPMLADVEASGLVPEMLEVGKPWSTAAEMMARTLGRDDGEL